MALELDQELMRMLLDTFAIQFDEQVQSITDGLLVLEKGVTGDERRQVLESVFRAAHNIKGAARGVEIPDVPDIAHHLESIFTVLKRGNINPDSGVTDIALESLDAMKKAMLAFSAQQPLGFDKAELIARLETVAMAVEKEGEVRQADQQASPLAAIVQNDHSGEVLEENRATEEQAFCAWDPSARIVAPSNTQPAEVNAVASSSVVKVNLGKLESLAALTEDFQVTKIEMDDHLAGMQQVRIKVQELMAGWRRHHTSGVVKYTQQDVEAWLASSADVIAELDLASAQMQREMRSSTSRLSMLVETLQDSVRMMRLVPVATLLRPMSRSVRDIARELNKQVNFVVVGDDIEIDRMVLDGVRDPLMHLLRNALDHGIESAEQRLSRGKTAEGKLQISVSSEGRQIVMTVQDDGEGISVEKVAASARKKKLVTEIELAAMGHAEIIDLIFRPGFSTRDIITSMSGRGVGLDVVVANLIKLKGSVQIATEEGKGTRFIMRLPITMTADNGVLVRSGGSVFAIPTSAVDRIMEIRLDQIIEVEASHAILHRGRSIPLRDLAMTLELKAHEALKRKILPVIVINKGWESVAFLVDEVIGEREIVVKPFRPPLHAVRNIMGGTLTGSGEVIMVLNPPDLVDSATRSSLSHLRASQIEISDKKVPHILVVDDSITTRSLEKSILEHAGYKVTVEVDGKRAWDLLQEQSFDLVVTDVEMPVMTGLELTDLIKQTEWLRGMPVIMVTSLAKEEDRQRGVDVGADAYIVKGLFETKALLDVVEQLV
ncbi:MAG: hybrid sensor histidine kinase/response regulator [Gallionella sp.]|nr:hybrid sensor histidine kinase/response regulator [Gallionella sp.]MDD4958264.1 hybrid sensor histidine kinase/response regulator [Gallionella sp.]